MEYLDPSIVLKYELKEFNIILNRYDEKPGLNNEVNLNIDQKNIDDEMEKNKQKYQLKEIKIILNRYDDKP